GLLRPKLSVLAIEVAQQIELAALLLFANSAWRMQIGNQFAIVLKADALVNGGHEPCAPIPRPVDDRRRVVLQHDKCGQVLIFGAEPVTDPRTQRWPPREDRASVHLADAGGMIEAIGPARADDCEIVDAFGDVRIP